MIMMINPWDPFGDADYVEKCFFNGCFWFPQKVVGGI